MCSREPHPFATLRKGGALVLALEGKNRTLAKGARMRHPNFKTIQKLAGGPSFREASKGWALVLSVGNQELHPCKGRKDLAPKIQNHSEARTASLRTRNGRIVSYAWDAAGSEQGS